MNLTEQLNELYGQLAPIAHLLPAGAGKTIREAGLALADDARVVADPSNWRASWYCGRCDKNTPTNEDGKCPVCTKYKVLPDQESQERSPRCPECDGTVFPGADHTKTDDGRIWHLACRGYATGKEVPTYRRCAHCATGWDGGSPNCPECGAVHVDAPPKMDHLAVTDAMVNRFLSWKLPKDFAPDCHISFKLPDPILNPNPSWPVGTNLLTADQARAMLEHVVRRTENDIAPSCVSCGASYTPFNGIWRHPPSRSGCRFEEVTVRLGPWVPPIEPSGVARSRGSHD